MARRGYPPEFRRRVLDLIEGGRTVSEVAAGFEVSEQTIYTWRRQARIDAGLEAGLSSSEHAELVELATSEDRVHLLLLFLQVQDHFGDLHRREHFIDRCWCFSVGQLPLVGALGP